MSHTVVRLTNAEATSELEAEKLVNEIKTELENRGYETTDVSIGDSTDVDGSVYVRAVTHHKLPSEADSWCNYLRKFVEARLGEELVSAKVDEHDCQHFENGSDPCRPVEWVYGR